MPRVMVVGAGPAGLAATEAALRRGANVILVDAGGELGGQFWRHPPAERALDPARFQHGWRHFRQLATALGANPDCQVITNAQVWAVETGSSRTRVHAAIGQADGPGREMVSLGADALVLATGAHDRTLPFPGWDLPGVFTGGAAQAMAKAERIAVGSRVVIAGAGPFLLPVAASLAGVGARVVGVYEAGRLGGLAAGWLPHAPWVATLPGKLAELAGYAASQARHRIPYRTGRAVVRAHGGDAVCGVTVARIDQRWRPLPGTERFVETDAVCVTHGFTPRLELAVAAGCAVGPDRFVAVDGAQRTSVDNVSAAGEITGIAGADAALAEGQIAGHIAAGGELSDSVLRAAVGLRRRHARLAHALRAAHGIQPGWTGWLSDDTVVCRCEEVTYGRLRSVLAATDSPGLRPYKLTTRAGIGPCQARICGRTVEDLLASCAGPQLDDASTDRRPIAAPVRFSELVAEEISAPEIPNAFPAGSLELDDLTHAGRIK